MSSNRSSRKSKKSESNANYSYESYTPEQKSFTGRSSQHHKTPISRSIKSRNESALASLSNSVATDSIYTHSFHGKGESPKIQGPPPLKRTFLSDSESTDEAAEVEAQGDASIPVYKKPEWKFPVKRITRNDDDALYEALRERFSVKNIVSQLKRSQ